MATVADLRHKHANVQKAYANLFSTPDGQIVMDDLCRRFYDTAAAKYDKDRRVDPNATLIQEGARQCVLYIRQQMIGGDDGRLEDPTS